MSKHRLRARRSNNDPETNDNVSGNNYNVNDNDSNNYNNSETFDECTLSGACGTVSEAASALRVINGQRVAVGEYKFLVTLLKNDQVVCTATIIDPSHVMTAAHCTIGLKARQLSVGIAEHDITKNDGEKIIKVKTLTQHPRYNDDQLVNDISVLTLAEPITGVKNAEPVCLPVNGQCGNLKGRKCVVAGWGATSQQGGFST
ncbi:trypsin 3A1-like [Haliotis rubra]|uniref:trypsin 3A1-like n=1 Tax=Haliotis rubra TaxID=36100 RepID=UPI001EE52E7D|nr:trypsin 3A1-like [Haliotis rubra]